MQPERYTAPKYTRFIPIPLWLLRYHRHDLPNDFIAGLTVAIMLIPQGMAYAVLAGLPPVVGLYAGILPGIAYGLLGSSRILTVGPTAITSVMVLSSIGGLAAEGSATYITLALTLALCLGIVYLLMGLLRLGFIVNLLSQPVLSGYVNAAAIVIVLSQLQHILGIHLENTQYIPKLLLGLVTHVVELNPMILLIGTASAGFLLGYRRLTENLLHATPLPAAYQTSIVRSGPLVVVIVATLFVYIFRLNETAGVRIIGTIPAGLPPLTLGPFDVSHLGQLLMGAGAIAFVGFMEGMSTIKSLASKKRQRIDANQELIAMGVSNVAAAFTGGLPVTTSISRSAVNHATGAKTGLSSIIASSFLALTVVFFTPLFYYLPFATLAAIIIVAVVKLFDFSSVRQIYRYNPAETLPFAVTFLGVFLFNIAGGIISGILVASVLHLWRTSRPYIATLGRIPESEHYRDSSHHETQLLDYALIIRVDESLYFANVQTLEDYLRNVIAAKPDVSYLILACNAINTIDASAMQILAHLIEEFHEAGIEIYLAEVKEQLLARLERVQFVDQVGRERFFKSIHEAAESANVNFYDFNWPI